MVSFFFFFWDHEDWVREEGWAELRVLFCLGAAGTTGVGGGVYTVNKKRVKREKKKKGFESSDFELENGW